MEDLNRTYIRDLITAKLSRWGSPYCYECYLNGERLRKVKDLKSKAEPGDRVRVDVTKNYALVHRVEFKIKRNDNVVENYREKNAYKLWNRPDDYQRSKLYSWERRFRDMSNLYGWDGTHSEELTEKFESTDEAERFLKNELLADHDNIETPNVAHHPNRNRWSVYRSGVHQIRLSNGRGFSKHTVVHEAAHAVVQELGVQHLVSFHGPVFVRVFIELLEPYVDESIERMVSSARDWGLDVAELSISDLADLSRDEKGRWESQKVSVDTLGKLRRETYHTKRGVELTETQLKSIRQFRNDERVDRRGGDALARRGFFTKTEDGYETGPRYGELIV